MKETVNVRFLGYSLAALSVLTGGWYGVHAYQMRQHRGTILTLVTQAEDEGNLDRAVRFLHQYIVLVPDDVDARERYGRLLERLPQNARLRGAIIDVYQQVLIRDSSRNDVRRRMAKLSFAVRDYDTAMTNLELLRKLYANDAELADLLGQCYEAKGRYKEADEQYKKAIESDPKGVATYVRRAKLLRTRLDNTDKANGVVQAMVKANKDSYEAYLASAGYLQEQLARATGDERSKLLQKAMEDAKNARKLAPKEVEPLLVSASLARESKDWKRAQTFLKTALKDHPDVATLYLELARVDMDMHQLPDALACLRRGLDRVPDDGNLLFLLGQLSIDHDDVAEVQRVIGRLKVLKLPDTYSDFLQARLEFHTHEWSRARLTLETLEPRLVESPQLSDQVYGMLGQCYERTGAADLALAAYRRGGAALPFNVNIRLATALSLLKLGRTEDAVQEARHAMRIPGAPRTGWVLLARLLTVQLLNQPAELRNWQEVEEFLKNADPKDPEVAILGTEVLVAKGDALGGQKLLEEKLADQPRSVKLWTALVDVYLDQGKLDDAQTALERAGKAVGDQVELRLARARYLSRRSPKDFRASLAALANGVDKLPPNEVPTLLNGLANIAGAESKDARMLWRRLADLRPDNLQVHLSLFDAALKENSDADMLKQQAAIQRIEGGDGPRGHFAMAAYLVWKAGRGDKSTLSEARKELAETAARLPTWSSVPVLGARIALLDSEEDQAMEQYLHAVELGNRQLAVIGDLVRLLYKHGRYHDADLVLRRLPERTPISADLQRLIAQISLQNNDKERALQAARKAVANNSRDYRDYVWLGQVLAAVGEPAEAEPKLRRAVQLAENVPDPWVALVQFFARYKRMDEAKKTLHQAEAKLDRVKARLALAQCYEAVGDNLQATKFYQDAVAAEPSSLAVRQAAANFYLRTGRLDKAKDELQAVLKLQDTPPDTKRRTRDMLAVVLSAGGDYQRSQQAMEMLGLLTPEITRNVALANPEDVRARAIVLAAQRSRAQKLDAINLLKQLDAASPLAPEDRFLLAQLEDATGDLPAAREGFTRVLAANRHEPRYVARYVSLLLRQGQLSDAGSWLDQLDQLVHDRFDAVGLRARWFKARGHDDEARALLNSYAEGHTNELAAIASAMDYLGYAGDAERLYRKNAARSQDPNSVLLLARHLGTHDQRVEALLLCQRAWATCPPANVARATSAVLHAGHPTGAEIDREQRLLEQALARKETPTLLVCLADLDDIRGNYGAAEKRYRDILGRDPRNIEALNNLAYLVVFHQKAGAEAIDLVDRAIAVVGPIPELLDTRACAYLVSGKPELAIADLNEALTQLGGEGDVLPTIEFHLAQGYQAVAKQKEAAQAMGKALAKGLDESKLHPLETPVFRHLRTELGS